MQPLLSLSHAVFIPFNLNDDDLYQPQSNQWCLSMRIKSLPCKIKYMYKYRIYSNTSRSYY